MNTLTPEQWHELAAEQHRRAMAGDAEALKWCERHKPAPLGYSGDHGTITREQLEAMTDAELASYIDEQRAIRDGLLAGGETG